MQMLIQDHGFESCRRSALGEKSVTKGTIIVIIMKSCIWQNDTQYDDTQHYNKKPNTQRNATRYCKD